MRSPEALSVILSVLYEAPSEPARWQDFLRLLSSAVAGEAGALLMHHFRDVRSAMSAEWGFHPDVSKLYAAHYGSIDVWRSATTASSDWLGISEQFVSVAELSRTEFYNDLLLPYGIEHGMFAMVERAPGRVANLSICRSARIRTVRGKRSSYAEDPDATRQTRVQAALRTRGGASPRYRLARGHK